VKTSFITLALVAALAGCAAVPDTPEQTVFAAKTGYAVALSAAAAYKNLPVCSEKVPVPCRQPAVMAQIQKADIVAAASLDAAEAAARTPSVGATATARAIQAANAALAALQSLVASLGVTAK
jgi:hypothetical protein